MSATEELAALAVGCTLLPLNDVQLLLPSATVVEVVNYQAPVSVAGAPEWLLGHVFWRGEKIPLVALETLLYKIPNVPGPRSRIVVVNTLGENPRLPHVGILVRDLPRMLRLGVADVAPKEYRGPSSPLALRRVTVAETPAVIPDLDALERLLEVGI